MDNELEATPDTETVETLQNDAEGGDEPTSDDATNESDTLEEPPNESDELVTELRSEAARYRTRLRDTERALWTERVKALGVLVDPDDLPYDSEALHDPEKLQELADELVGRKPHLRSRAIRGRAGQGEGTSETSVSLAGMLRRGA